VRLEGLGKFKNSPGTHFYFRLGGHIFHQNISAMKTYGAVDVHLHVFLASALLDRPFYPQEETGLDNMERRKVLPLPPLPFSPVASRYTD
jgi:hypothetical protein